MARVTVEDCIEVVPNRFDLVVLASRRAREISCGAHITVPRDNDKNPVIALREIAEQTISAESLREQVVRGMQRVGFVEEAESDLDEEILSDYIQTSMATADTGEEEDDDVDADDHDDDISDHEGEKDLEINGV